MRKAGNSQLKAVREYLLSHPDGLTQEDAKELCGTTRLGALIWRLRHEEGYKINSVQKKLKTRYGNTCVCAVYQLVKEDNGQVCSNG